VAAFSIDQPEFKYKRSATEDGQSTVLGAILDVHMQTVDKQLFILHVFYHRWIVEYLTHFADFLGCLHRLRTMR
jgi:hypothetical protein